MITKADAYIKLINACKFDLEKLQDFSDSIPFYIQPIDNSLRALESIISYLSCEVTALSTSN